MWINRRVMNDSHTHVRSTTFVSAFIKDINLRTDRTIDDYIEMGNHLLKTNFNKVIFIDEVVYMDFIYGNDDLYPTTYFILIKKSDLYLEKYKKDAINFSPVTNNSDKDTYDYFMVQCMKTEWMCQAIELDIFGGEQFVWMDFGIYHFINNDNELIEGMMSISSKCYDKVRIPIVNPPDFPYYSRNILNEVVWMFAGSIFGGDKKSLIEFARVVRNKCIMCIEDYGKLMWEINIWYLVFFENVALFDLYMVNTHDKHLLCNY